jgi:hypothetical protein
MSVQTPVEISYYYENSYGDFRLVYHIPINILTKLVEQDKIAKKALKDFPDGIDIDCSVPDYNEFEKAYRYRPSADPEAVRRTFRSLISSIEIWDDFIGTGFLGAKYLESLINKVDRSLEAMKIKFPAQETTPPTPPSLEERRKIRIEQTQQQIKINTALDSLPLAEIDPKKPQTRQALIPKMGKGDSPEQIFANAQKGKWRQRK